MPNWKEYRLDEIADILNNKRIPLSSQIRSKRQGKYPYYGASGIVDYIDDYIFDGEHVLISEDGENLRSRNTPIAFKADGKFWVNNHAHIVKGKKPFLNDWIVYYFKNIDVNPYITGAVQPKLNKENLLSIPIKLPDFTTAESISEILSSLDDKIELNNQINQELEALAQALFKQWFIDFEFPNENGQPYKSSGGEMVESELGEIPKGWIEGVLSDVIEFNPTERLVAGKEASYLDMSSLPTKGSWPDKPILRAFSSGMKFRNGDTLFARITPCLENGKTAFIQCLNENEVGWGSTEYIVLRPKHPWPKEIGYLIARNDKFRSYAIQSMIGTSGRQRAQSSHLENYPIIYPTDETIMVAIGKVLESFFQQIKINSEENQYLSQLRDTLLPKLISGELEVSEALTENKKPYNSFDKMNSQAGIAVIHNSKA